MSRRPTVVGQRFRPTSLASDVLATPAPADPLLTPAEAAQHLRVSLRKVQQLRQTGELPPTRIGSRAVVRLSDLDRYVASLGATSLRVVS